MLLLFINLFERSKNLRVHSLHEEQSPRGFNQRSNAEIHPLMLPYLYFRILIDQENIQQVIMGTKNMKMKVS